jgi:2-polyprenyl-6-methoxyphenol hydroxylase-like FAD-dependent oxidoreductase
VVKIAIVGGGIGGMTLALALADAGLADVDVYESAPDIREIEVGILLRPHGVREFDELGLLDVVLAEGIPTTELIHYSRHGQTIGSGPCGLADGYRWPEIAIHRGRLLGILHRAVLERLGPDRVHTGFTAVGIGQDERRAWCEFIDRPSGRSRDRIEADLVVGCDGVHSVVRRTFYPDEGPLLWNGRTRLHEWSLRGIQHAVRRAIKSRHRPSSSSLRAQNRSA